MLTKKKITNNLFGVNPLFWPNLTILPDRLHNTDKFYWAHFPRLRFKNVIRLAYLISLNRNEWHNSIQMIKLDGTKISAKVQTVTKR